VTQCRNDLRLSPSLATATPKIQGTLEQMEINEFNRVRKKMNEFIGFESYREKNPMMLFIT
jgi:hypothetical protein